MNPTYAKFGLAADRNPGIAFDPARISHQRINRAATERRIGTLLGSRSLKQEYQAAWLVRAIECMDLTSLSGDDTPGRIERLCHKAMRPLKADLLDALGLERIHVGAVCVYHEMISTAVTTLGQSGIPVAAVSTAFPAGLSSMETKLREIELSVAAGAREIDIVITRRHVLNANWQALYDEMQAYRKACGEAHVKAILATGDLATLDNVAKASWTCMMGGADFIKTSTGKETVNASLPVAVVMARSIRDYAALTGYRVGFKPAGGVSTAKSALQYLSLIREELGHDWVHPHWLRIGASSLLTDIERQLEHFVTGFYSADYRHPMP